VPGLNRKTGREIRRHDRQKMSQDLSVRTQFTELRRWYYFRAYQSFPGGDNGHRNRHETGFYLIFERRAANVIKRGQKARRSKFVWTKKHISGRVWVLLTINYVGN
jgi:hypothetical protein